MAEASPSSLDVYRQTIPGQKSCPRADHWYFNAATGEKQPGRCRRQTCLFCVPLEAWWKAKIISHGGDGPPQRLVTFTQAPENWDTLRQKVAKLTHTLRHKHGLDWEIAWTVELTKQDVPHIHALQKGSYVPQALLQDAWGAIVDIRAIKSDRSAVAGYALKEAMKVAGYATKEANTAEGALAHKALNGNRLVHLTRGYLGGHRSEEVRKLILDEISEAKGEEGNWQRIKLGHTPSA